MGRCCKCAGAEREQLGGRVGLDLVGGNGPHMEEMQTREAGAGAAGVRLWCWPGPGHVTEAAKRRLESGLVSETRAAGGLACPCSTRESWRAPSRGPKLQVADTFTGANPECPPRTTILSLGAQPVVMGDRRKGCEGSDATLILGPKSWGPWGPGQTLPAAATTSSSRLPGLSQPCWPHGDFAESPTVSTPAWPFSCLA